MINKFLMAIICAVVLSACSSTEDKSYYQLPVSAQSNTEKVNVISDKQIWLTGVNTSDHLNGLGIVYQTSDVEYVMARNHLWASSLQYQLQQQLVSHLNDSLADWLVLTQPMTSNKNRLTVNITGFHGRYDGQVVVTGDWIFSYKQQNIKKHFNVNITQTQDGYSSLVRTLSKGWLQVTDEIADTIKHVNMVN